jgi:hypothetical protein
LVVKKNLHRNLRVPAGINARDRIPPVYRSHGKEKGFLGNAQGIEAVSFFAIGKKDTSG